ncbi:hypothetical protein tb265_27260 [Gemmatimonadetes bacterium T265]|nr:hypothetical protein tb265_27260 [Gemmatimonadetes bacterium T265]
MRSPVRAATAALVLTAASASVRPAAAQAAAKFGYVEVATVLEQVPGRADAQQTLEREGQAIQAEAARMNDSLNTMTAAYQRAQATLTPAQRQTRERELQAKQQEYQQRFQALQERGARRQQELAGGFETLVRQAIEDVRTTGGYTMIFASGPNSPMLAADKSLDVTDQVLARIRTVAAARGTAPATAARPAAPAGAAPATAGAARPRTP